MMRTIRVALAALLLASSAHALTAEQILNRANESADSALRVKVINGGGGGGAATSFTSGTTTITGGADTSPCFQDGASPTGTINCADTGWSWNKTTNALTATTFVGALTGNASTATTATTANAGDSATAFFSAGTLEATRGGTGDDTSGTSGVPYITSGNWLYATFVSGGIPYANGASSIAFSAALGAGEVVLGGGAGSAPTSSSAFSSSGSRVNAGVVDAANSLALNEVAGQITAEGATADAFETRIAFADPTVGDSTWTVPNGAGAARTFASLEAAQTFTNTLTVADVTMSAGNLTVNNGRSIVFPSNMGGLAGTTTMTPDAPQLRTGTAGNSWHLIESADSGSDFNNGWCGTSACTNPAFIVHGPAQNATDYSQIDAFNMRLKPVAVGSLPACGSAVPDGTQGAVTDSNAASFTVGIGAVVAAGGTTHVPVYCDGTNWRIG